MGKLGIRTVVDRASPASHCPAVAPCFEAHFIEGSYGYRSGRSAQQGIIMTSYTVRASSSIALVFSFCYGPMNVLAGVRLSTSVVPLWAKVIFGHFPSNAFAYYSTYTAYEKRNFIYFTRCWMDVAHDKFMVLITILILRYAERNARKNDALTFY